jgi:hypothetical protein
VKSTAARILVLALTIWLLSVLALAQSVPAWQNNTAYKVGDLVLFNGQEYRCQIAHTSQLDWTPDVAHSLWALVQAAAPDFAVSATPAQQSVTAGGAVSYTVSVAALNGFTGTVSLTVSGLPAGATAKFSSSSISTSGSSTLTISTASSTVAANSTLTITGQSGSVSHSTTVTLVVSARTPDFAISASPASQTVPVGGSTTYTAAVTAVNGFTGTVSLNLSGLPAGVTGKFNPASIAGSGSLTLTISTSTTTTAGAFTVTITGSSGSLNHATTATLNIGSVQPARSTGTIRFHLLLGVSTGPQDSLTLDGDNYTDLIMSNMIAGVIYGHMIQEYAPLPGIQFNKDYLYGSVMAQLLQENISTQEYQAGTNFIDPAPDQQAVMGVGQGGPYQINNYAVDLVAGGTAPAGHSLINYVAIQKNIGFTIANAANQFNQPTPPSFNNKFYGPMLTAYFHYNDFVSLNVIGKAADGAFTPPWQPQYDQALNNFVNLPNSFLDIILNEAYNQGFYGGLVAQTSRQGATANPATVAAVNSYSSVFGNTSTFVQYPYQVHYYLDQMYDNPIPTTSATALVTPNNHILFNMNTLESVFANIFQTLAHSNGTSPAQFFTATEAQSAFNSALSANGVSITATLDLSNSVDRTKIFAVIDTAIGNLETAAGMKFNATTTSQL